MKNNKILFNNKKDVIDILKSNSVYKNIVLNSEVKDIMDNKGYIYEHENIKISVLCKLNELSIELIDKWLKENIKPEFTYLMQFIVSTSQDIKNGNNEYTRSLTYSYLINSSVKPGEIFNLISLSLNKWDDYYIDILPKEEVYIWSRIQLVTSPVKVDKLSIQREKDEIKTHGCWHEESLMSYILPLNNNYNTWGKIMTENEITKLGINYNNNGIYYKLDDIYIIYIEMKKTKVNGEIYKFGNIYSSFEDTINNGIIKRYYSTLQLRHYIKDNELMYFEKDTKAKGFRSFKSRGENKRFGIFHIETYIDNNGYFIPYACGYFSNHLPQAKIYYLSDYENSQEMIFDCIETMICDPNVTVIYNHNLSKFGQKFIDDMVESNKFNIKRDVKYGKDLEIIRTLLKIDDKKIELRDSNLMLPGALQKYISNITEIKNNKLPYKFINKFTLNYIGNKPDKLYYKDITEQEYNEIPLLNWNCKENISAYMINDLFNLWKVIDIYKREIMRTEGIDPTNYHSIASLVFDIWKKGYYKSKSSARLYTINGVVRYDIQNAYFGGSCEVFKRTNNNDDLYVYDINSSYPSAMLKNMPYGKPILSNDKILENYKGFVYAKITTPKDINGEFIEIRYPPLPYRIKGDEGLNLMKNNIINPIGEWYGIYSSEILKWVKENYNYEIEVIYGYKFKSTKNLFNDYVEKYYEYKNTIDNKYMSNIAKMKLNTLYGRFGLNPILYERKIVSNNQIENMILDKHNVNIINKNTGYSYIEYTNISKNKDLTPNSIPLLNMDHNIAIAATITTYSHIKLYDTIRLIEQLGGEIYYIDTDSIHCNIELPNEIVSNKLGDWKLETYSNKAAYYIKPKTYFIDGYKDKTCNESKIVIKASSISNAPKLLNEEIYKNTLFNNEKVNIPQDRFIIDNKSNNIQLITKSHEFNNILNKRILIDNINTKAHKIILKKNKDTPLILM